MLIPKSSIDPLWREDGRPFADKMRDYIRRHYGDMLGADVNLLDRANGLDQLSRKYSTRQPVITQMRKASKVA